VAHAESKTSERTLLYVYKDLPLEIKIAHLLESTRKIRTIVTNNERKAEASRPQKDNLL
jgi:hypothetical protein